MLPILMPNTSLKNTVMIPLRPSSMIQLYAPMKGALMQHRMEVTNRNLLPLSWKKEKK